MELGFLSLTPKEEYSALSILVSGWTHKRQRKKIQEQGASSVFGWWQFAGLGDPVCAIWVWGSKKLIIKEAKSSITVVWRRKRNIDVSDKTVPLIFLSLLFMKSFLFLWRLDDPVN